LLKTMSPVIPR